MSRVLGWLAVFALLLLVYVATAQRGPSWQDSGSFQARVIKGAYTDRLGLALSHPLYILLARGFTHLFWGNPLWATSAFSGIGAAVTAANLYLLARWRNVPGRAATIAAVAFGLTPTVWWLSTVSEVYTLSIALLSTEVLLVYVLTRLPSEAADRRRPSELIGLLGLTSGLHLSDHNLALVSLPAIGLVLVMMVRRGDIKGRQAAWFVPGFALGSIPILAIFVHHLNRSGSLTESMGSLLVGPVGGEVGSVGPLISDWKNNLPLVALDAMTVIAAFGLWVALRHVRARRHTDRGRDDRDLFWIYLAAATALHALFFIRYAVPDLFTFVLPSLLLLAVWAISALTDHPKLEPVLLGGVVLSVAVLWLLPTALAAIGLAHVRNTTVPYRNENAYWIQPWKQSETSAARFSKEVFRLPNRAALIADDTTRAPLLAYQQSTGSRPDLDLVSGDPVNVDRRLVTSFTSAGHQVFVMTSSHANLRLLSDKGLEVTVTHIPGLVSVSLLAKGTTSGN
jgi:hypothetical protein